LLSISSAANAVEKECFFNVHDSIYIQSRTALPCPKPILVERAETRTRTHIVSTDHLKIRKKQHRFMSEQQTTKSNLIPLRLSSIHRYARPDPSNGGK
jgi:hypothetical protein